MNENDDIIGVDIGLNISYVAISRGSIDVIPNIYNGKRGIPSIVSFYKNDILIGETDNPNIYPSNKIYDIVNLIGKNYNDEYIQYLIKKVPFKIIKDSNSNKIKIEVEYKGKIQNFYPEELYSMLLSFLKKISEAFLGKKITKVILTVPTYYNNNQRELIKYAARISELNVIRIINEPTAACIAYNFNSNMNIVMLTINKNESYVSILSIINSCFYYKAVSNIINIGSDDFINKIFKYFKKEINEQIGIDFSNKNYKQLKTSLKIQCEKIQAILNILNDVTFYGSDIGINNFTITITREDFNNLCKELFEKYVEIINQTIKNFDLNKKNFTIILKGDNNIIYIPQLQKILNPYNNNLINSEELISIGAAILGNKNNMFEEKIEVLIGEEYNQKEELQELKKKNEEQNEKILLLQKVIEMIKKENNELNKNMINVIEKNNNLEKEKESLLKELNKLKNH